MTHPLETLPLEIVTAIVGLASSSFQAPMVKLLGLSEGGWTLIAEQNGRGVDLGEDLPLLMNLANCNEASLLIGDLQASSPNNIAVTGIRFFAGHAITSLEGARIGYLIVMDVEARSPSTISLQPLQHLVFLLEDHLSTLQLAPFTHRLVESLQTSEDRFRTTFDQAAVGLAHVGLDGQWLRVNRRLCEIVGYPEASLLQKTFQEITYADDLDSDLGYLKQMLAGEIETYTMEKRYRRQDGELIWANLTVSLHRDFGGNPEYFISAVQDISAHKAAEIALKQSHDLLEQRVSERTHDLVEINEALGREIEHRMRSEQLLEVNEERLRTITDNLPVLVAYVDPQMRYRFNNLMYERWYKIPREDLQGQHVRDFHGEETFGLIEPYIRIVLGGQAVSFEMSMLVFGRLRYFSTNYTPHFSHDEKPEVLGFYVMVQDITDRKQVELNLFRDAMVDPLTGLANRRAFMDQMERALQRSNRTQRSLAVLFVDLDHFKQVNDTHGHDNGDMLLKEVASRLTECVRKTDSVARLGGDEFTLILEGLDNAETQAELVVKKILQRIGEPLNLKGTLYHPSISIGYTLRNPQENSSAQVLLTEADAAMYRAKRAGRNQYSH